MDETQKERQADVTIDVVQTWPASKKEQKCEERERKREAGRLGALKYRWRDVRRHARGKEGKEWRGGGEEEEERKGTVGQVCLLRPHSSR